MALAFLCSKLRRYHPEMKITDNHVGNFRGFVVDHRLRDGSDLEAASVVRALRGMGLDGEVIPVNWRKEIGEGTDPRALSNMETVARRARYRTLGRAVAFRRMATLLLAHHEDDQYETVLMRLLRGHGSRGLRGMRRASGIPECEGLFGAYQSGWVDDQKLARPFYSTLPSARQRRFMTQELRRSINQLMEEEPSDGWATDLDGYPMTDNLEERYCATVGTSSLSIEDGGICIYRPLLGFSKDRLVATCLENKVPWWEDQTNDDPTLTMRNAVRHMYKSHELPRALQKPAILALSRTAEARAQAQEAEATRLLRQTIVHDFVPQVGSLVVQFPEVAVPRSSRRHLPTGRHQRRVSQKRVVAAMLVQRILELVSPETETPPLSNLQNVVSFLFPHLAEPGRSALPPRAFPIAGLHFMPIESTPQSVAASIPSHPRTWYISRLPYQTSTGPPTYRVPYWTTGRRWQGVEVIGWSRRRFSTWLPWHLWDGRFWIRMSHRLPNRVVVMPFLPEHAKPFRESLRPEDRDRLNSVLKRFAPGKVRYTLPAIYSTVYIEPEQAVPKPGDAHSENGTASGSDVSSSNKGVDPPRMRLLALPTLDVQLPGLENWVLYEVRHKRVDRNTLQTANSFSESCFVPPSDLKRRWSRAVRVRMRGGPSLRRKPGKQG
jgi:tRNA(Ile)-lysidine synthase